MAKTKGSFDRSAFDELISKVSKDHRDWYAIRVVGDYYTSDLFGDFFNNVKVQEGWLAYHNNGYVATNDITKTSLYSNADKVSLKAAYNAAVKKIGKGKVKVVCLKPVEVDLGGLLD